MRLDQNIGRILLKGMWNPNQVKISWNSSVHTPPNGLKKDIELFWDRIKNRHLYNGILARLSGFDISNHTLRLDLQPTEYKTLLYSNEHTGKLIAHYPDYLSRALGISAIIETTDDRIVYIKRSRQVGEYPGVFDVPGGHIDVPDTQAPDIFTSMRQEIVEELGITAPDDLCLIGLVETRDTLKPELVFRTRTPLNTLDIQNQAQRAKDRFEYTHLYSCHKTELDDLLAQKTFSPSAHSSIVLYIQKTRG